MNNLFLHICIGPPGSGKSTWAKKFVSENPDVVYLSSDKMRSKFGTGEHDQGVSSLVFDRIRLKCDIALMSGHSVVLDATFIKKGFRKDFITVGRNRGAWVVAHVFTADKNTLVNRVKTRAENGGLFVSENAIVNFIKMYEPPDSGEFDEVIKH